MATTLPADPDTERLAQKLAEATGKPLSYFVADDAAPAGIDPVVRKLERAAEKLSAQADRIEQLLEEVRTGLARSR